MAFDLTQKAFEKLRDLEPEPKQTESQDSVDWRQLYENQKVISARQAKTIWKMQFKLGRIQELVEDIYN